MTGTRASLGPHAARLLLAVSLACLSVADSSRAQESFESDPEAAEDRARAEEQARLQRQTALPLPGQIDPDTYVLGPGDVIEVLLWGNLNRRIASPIDPEGVLFIPDVGPVELAGRTLSSARQEILSRFGQVLTKVHIQVRLLSVRRQIVYASGEVARPGSYEATGVSRVSEVLLLAGGLLELSSRRNIRVVRQTGDSLRADLVRFERLGDLHANPFLSGGDVVWVPPLEEAVFVLGAVHRPGRVERVRGETIADLVRLAGGLRPEAAPEGAILVRFRSATELDTMPVPAAALTDSAASLELVDGDRVFIPGQGEWRDPRTVAIRGEVAQPGNYPVDEGTLRISGLIERAGGVLPSGNPSTLQLFRFSPAAAGTDPELERLGQLSRSQMTESEYQYLQAGSTLRRSIFLVDLVAIAAGDTSHDVRMENGDSVVVARRSDAVRVGGVVRRPGLVLYQPGWDVDDYIESVGGFGDRASKGKVRIQRGAQLLRAKEIGLVQPGDYVFVPEKRESNVWAIVRDAAVVAASIAAVVAVINSN